MKIKILIFVFYLFTNYLIAGSNTGASFLKIGIGARAIGLGSAFTAVSDDVTAIHWNPAGLLQLSKREIQAMHSEWLTDTRLNFIGYAQPTKKGVFACSVIYLSQSELEGRSETRQKTGSFTANDLAITLGYSNQFAITDKRQLTTGINLKFIRQQIESEQALGIALDFGSLYHFTALPLTAGFSIQNIGPQMKFINESYKLPLTVTTGLSYTISVLNLALDIKQQVYEGKTIISFGTEYLPTNIFALRLGYTKLIGLSNLTDTTNLTGFGAGLGLKLFSNYQIDYSFVPYGLLGDTHRISFSAKF